MIWKPFLLLLLAPSSLWAMDGVNPDLSASYNLVLPDAVRFEPVSGAPYVRAYNAADELLGWAAISTDVTTIKGYSGKPLVTVVGLDPAGLISGARVLEHSEPILLVGIPESELHDLVAFYKGKPAIANIVIGTSPDADALKIDGISGATVTVLAQNQTIMEVARSLGAAVGILEKSEVLAGHFVEEEEAWTFAKLERKGVFAHLRVTESEMGYPNSDGLFMDLRFTLADSPQVGKALLAPGEYAYLKKKLKPGEHLLVVLANGSASFKGSGFVRGGMFDRVRLQQKLEVLFFRDEDYYPISKLPAPDAPEFKEGAVFITRNTNLDPGQPMDLVFLGSRYDGAGAFTREFHEFKARLRLPKSVYKLDVPDPETLIWRQAWANKRGQAIVLAVFLSLVVAAFAARRWTTGNMKRLRLIHYGAMTFSVLVLGFWFGAQPSITQVLTFAGELGRSWNWNLFLTEPLIFILWIFIAVVSLAWGRGVFCGWVCPYGALTELLFKIAEKLGVKPYELPESVHTRLRYLRYLILVGLIPVFLFSPALGERLAEIEPFKTTFFVTPWLRHWGFLAWWLLLLLLSVFWYRPFCRYLCPLGAGLALPSSLRLSGPRRRNFCTSCKICTRGCEPRAINRDGRIDPRECLSCMECEANFRGDEICPPLIGLAKIPSPAQRSARDLEKLARLRKEAQRV